MPGKRSKGRRIAVTGAAGFLGRHLLARLEADENCGLVLALDIRRPLTAYAKTRFEEVDLTSTSADQQVLLLLDRENIDTLVHLAFLSNPTHDYEFGHELEAIGTMHILNACTGALDIRRVVMQSSTMVYGANPHHPNFLGEDTPLADDERSRWVRDRVDAERQAARFARRNPKIGVCVLRFAPVLGPTTRRYLSRFFKRPLVPTIAGYDPLMQFIHEEDAIDALHRATMSTTARGPLNIVGDGVLPLSTVLKLAGRFRLPIPAAVALPGAHVMWLMKLSDVPGAFFDYFRYLWVADGQRAAEELDFYPRYSQREIVANLGA